MLFKFLVLRDYFQCHFGDTALEKRQRVLRRLFRFACACPACEEDYPQSAHLPDTYSSAEATLRSDSSQSRHQLDLRDEELRRAVSEAVAKGDVAAALEAHCQRALLAADNVVPPHRILLVTRASITDGLWILHGNRATNQL
jgi:hypothetical protein